jgi:hypothetical protein
MYITLLALVLLPSGLSAYDLEFLSQEKISRNPHSALLRPAAINVLYMYSAVKNKHYAEFDFGAKIPGITVRDPGFFEIEIGGSGGVFSRFELFSESFNFIHADFNGSLYTDVKYKNFLFETSVYHTSSHIGDDYIKYDHAGIRNTGYEAVKQYASFTAGFLDVGIGFDYKFSRRPKSMIIPNPSIFIGTRLDLLSLGIPFFMECEIEAIVGNYLPNIGIRAGVYLKYIMDVIFLKKSRAGKEPHELAFYYYNGYSKMGYFNKRREHLILFGPTYRY